MRATRTVETVLQPLSPLIKAAHAAWRERNEARRT
jgi:hypothetical protein